MTPQPHASQSVVRELVLFVFAAAVVRALVWWAMGRAIDSADAILYLETAQHFYQGDFANFYTRIPVLYPALVAIAHVVIPDVEYAARFVSLVASSLTVVPIYLLARNMLGLHAARIAALAVVVAIWPADYASRETPEALACLLWFCGVYTLSNATNAKWTSALVPLGFFFALHLTRPEGTFILLASIPLLFAYRWMSGNKSLAPTLVYAALAVVALVGYSYLLKAVTGVSDVNSRVTSASAAAHFVLVSHAVPIGRAFVKLVTEVLPMMIGPYALLFAGVSLFRIAKRNLALEGLVLAFAALQVVLAALSSYPEPRYIMVTVLAATIWAAHGMAITSETLCARNAKRVVVALPVIGMLLIACFHATIALGPGLLGRMPHEPREFRDAGRWMRDNLEPGLILARKPQIGFYAGMPTTGPASNDTPETLVERAQTSSARYVVIDERYTANIAPGLAPLLDPVNAPAQLTLKQMIDPPYDGGRVAIYAVSP